MRTIGNILWVIFGGLFSAIVWMIAGIILCITIIGIPFGMQCFKIAGLVLWPFGRTVDAGNFGFGGLLLNILWAVLIGWELFVSHIIWGVVFCLSIVGIPFGLQHFKFALVALIPFGAQIRKV